MTVTPEGAITLIERQIARKQLPVPVAKTLRDKYPKARYRIVEEVIEVRAKEEKLVYYEVLLVTSQKQIWGVELGLDGQIIKTEDKTSEEEED